MYTECPGLVLRNVGGSFSTAVTAEAQWQFYAPPGTSIGSVEMTGSIQGRSGWQATIFTDNGHYLDNCPATTCPGLGKTFAFRTGDLGASILMLRLRCGAQTCPNDRGIRGLLAARHIVVHLNDATPPAVGPISGNLLTGWRRGSGSVSLNAADNVGIKFDRLLVDGALRAQRVRPCQWGTRIPCPNGGASLGLDTRGLSDGRHTLTVQAVDAADNVAEVSRPILVDNSAPATPLKLRLAGGSRWRATNRFAISWENPRQQHAPIAGALVRLCPAANAASNTRGCIGARRSSPNLRRITDLAVPRPGAWRLRLWLVDAAGNADRHTAVETMLRFDNVPPTAVFRQQTPHDPARLRVAASDAASSIAHVDIEARRQGEALWRQLPVEPGLRGEYSAFMDDELLPAGLYELRARAVDRAGNERTAVSRDNGYPAVLQLPVRRAATLRIGGRTAGRCRGHGSKRRCRSRLVAAPRVPFGRKVRLSGRLTVERSPLRAAVEVWRRVKLPGAGWEQVAVVHASKRGRVRFTVPRGPARHYRFRFPGSPTTRGATKMVDARVRAASSLRASRRNVVNGEYVTFRGRLKGSPIPPGGKLVELQVYTRRRWRTFAQPRARASTGRWAFQYRFEAVRGRARFRFRARIRREVGYPYHMGTSHNLVVTVRGL